MSEKTTPNSKEFKNTVDQLKAILKEADKRGHSIDPSDIEHAMAWLNAHEGGFQPDGLVQNTFFRIGQGVGLVTSIVAEPLNAVLPASFHAGYSDGRGKAIRFYRKAGEKCSTKAKSARDTFKSTLNTKPAESPEPAAAAAS